MEQAGIRPGNLELKRLNPVRYLTSSGHTITMNVPRLLQHEAKPLHRLMVEVQHRLYESKALTPLEQARVACGITDEIPDDVLRHWFGYLRDIGGITLDGQEVDGPQLLEIADDKLKLFVLMALEAYSKVTDVEGKGFGSRSTSSSEEPAPESTSSDAAPTVEGDGTGPLTAIETLVDESSSLQPVEA